MKKYAYMHTISHRRKKKVKTETRLHKISTFFDSNLLVTPIQRPTTLQLTAREPCLFVSRVVHHAKYSDKYLGYIFSAFPSSKNIIFVLEELCFLFLLSSCVSQLIKDVTQFLYISPTSCPISALLYQHFLPTPPATPPSRTHSPPVNNVTYQVENTVNSNIFQSIFLP